MNARDVEQLLKLTLIGGGLFLVYKFYSQVSKVGQTASDMTSQLAELGDSAADPTGATFAAWYDPTQRTVFFYWLTFPDGVHHMIWASDVDPNGIFTYDNENYRIGTDRAGGLRAYYYQPQ